MAQIQFSKGVTEETVPDVRLTRSRDGSNGTATFYFQNPQVLSAGSSEEVTGMYLIDEEGELVTTIGRAEGITRKPAAMSQIRIVHFLPVVFRCLDVECFGSKEVLFC